MKTVEQIRRRIAEFEAVKDVPCGCAGTKHEQACKSGEACASAAIDAMMWVLGESNKHTRFFDELYSQKILRRS